MLDHAPTNPQSVQAWTDKAGRLTLPGVTALQEMWKQVAPGFPVVPCHIAGTNALTLTPTLTDEGAATLADGMVFSGVAAHTSTGAVTAALGSLAAKKVFKLAGATQAGSGDLVAASAYLFLYESSLGFVLLNGAFEPLLAAPPIRSVVRQVIVASGNYVPSAGMVFADLEGVGSGAGGGGTANSGAGNIASGGGGGGGEYAIVRVTAAQVGASQVVTIGAVASGGTAGNNAGTGGNDTSVGALLVAKGGTAGGGSAPSSGTAGAGGTGGTGDYKVAGESGTNGGIATIITAAVQNGQGGASGKSLGFGGTTRTTQGTGANGQNYGGGGSGGMSVNAGGTAAGGDGAIGVVIATEYLSS